MGGREKVPRQGGGGDRERGPLLAPVEPDLGAFGTRLSAPTGLSRTGVSLARVPGEEEAFVYHFHHREEEEEEEEEWIYVISGRGVAAINGDEFEVGAGSFMGFPTPSVSHHLRNPYDEDLVYLMGGENLDVEVADFPRLGKRMLRRGGDVEIYDASDAESFGPLDD